MGVAAVFLATGLYLSYIPVKLLQAAGWRGARKWTGAGLIGTLEGLVLTPFLPQDEIACVATIAAATAAAVWICGKAEQTLGHDDPRIVLDEVVGYWASVALLPRTAGVLVAGFIVFRFLDSFKMPPYRWLERLPGGAGIVGDDVGAGVCANLLLRGAISLWPALAA